jgi:hypothetical protein
MTFLCNIFGIIYRFDKEPNDAIPGSKAWTVIFPILIILIIVGLGIWKRKELKEYYNKKVK